VRPHHRDGAAALHLRALLTGGAHTPGVPGGLHRAPHRCLGHPAGPPAELGHPESEGLAVALSPPRSPWANGVAERWIRSVRRECLDQLLILNERHLPRVVTAYTTFYNERRLHQGLGQACPVPPAASPGSGPIWCREVLGGILHDYYRTAA
jgi:hypothetical protein